MTLKEILKAQGLSTEQINGVLSNMKENKLYITNLEKADERYEKLQEKYDDLQGQLTKANGKITELKEFEKDNEALKNKLSSWETEKANFEKAIAQKDFDYALDKALEGTKAKNINLVKALLKKEDLKLINGKIDGLDTQIENIKKENDFLFEKTVKGAPDFTSGGNGGGATPTVKSIGEKLGERITSNSEASKKVDNFFS